MKNDVVKNFYDIHQNIIKSFEGNTINKDCVKDFKGSFVNYDELTDQLRREIRLVDRDLHFDDTFRSIFVWGPTGTGKTEIIKSIAEEFDAVYHKLEIQKVPIEELQGFPYLHKSKKGETFVRLAHPTDLPPTDDERLWVFHLDEFNKADTETMAAVMNLVLTGEIGGSADYNEETGKSEKYRLPRRTIIIGSGNPREQENTASLNLVNNFDIATAERWHRNLYIDYDAPSWITNFAIKNYNWNGYNLSTRIPNIIIYYILNKYAENGKKSEPFLIPKSTQVNDENDDEAGSTMSPRAWTLAANEILSDAFLEWEELNDEEKIKYNNDFDKYQRDPNVQIRNLIKNPYEFGINSEKLVTSIVQKFIYFFDNKLTPEDILINYSPDVRKKVKNIKEKKGSILYLIYGIGNYIYNSKEALDFKKYAVNVSTFIQDAEIPAEDLTLLCAELSRNNVGEEFNDYLQNFNERYKTAYQSFFYIGSKEMLKDSSNKDKESKESE